jgi:PAS domain S-box-containing protein
MVKNLDDFRLFLSTINEIDLIDYILFSCADNLKVEASSKPIAKLLDAADAQSPWNEILPGDLLDILNLIGKEGAGMEVFLPGVIPTKIPDVNKLVVYSSLRGFVALLIYYDDKDLNLLSSKAFRLCKDIFFYYSIEDQRVQYITNSVTELLGYSPEEIEANNFNLIDKVHPDDIKVVEVDLKEKLRENKDTKWPLISELRIRNKSGDYQYILLKSVARATDKGNYITGIAKDITEKKDREWALKLRNQQLENAIELLRKSNTELAILRQKLVMHNAELEETNEKLTSSEEMFRQLAENTNEIFWLRDEKEILYINNQFEKIWGRGKEELIENPYKIIEWIHPEDVENVEPWVNLKNLIKGTPFVEQYRIIKPNGQIRWLWSRTFPIFDKDDKPYRVVGITSDITDQKEFEEALRIAKEKAQESDMLKSTFLANISHEIRTPMNGIIGFAELLTREEIDSATRKNYVAIMKKSSEQLVHIIDDIIDFAKIEANQIRLQLEKVNINRLLDHVFVMFQNQLKQKGTDSITLLIEKNLSNDVSEIVSDEHRISQVMSYLIENAIKYTQNGFVKFGCHLKEGKLEFFVHDSGIGIPQDKHELIFERFRQADEGHTRKFGGTGLGLPISKGLVNLLGGNIWLESNPGSGSKFFFTIPYRAAIEQSENASKTKKEDDLYNWKDKLILVAEDDELNFEYIKILLEPTEAKIIRAKDGSQAVKICSNLNFDLILMDIRLPILNGIQATQQLREMGIMTPIIAQTAFAMDDDEQRCLDAGCNNYISKPISKEKLFDLIDALI